MDHDQQICLADYEPALPKVAAVLQAEYRPGTFEAAEDDFHDSGEGKRWWTLEGPRGSLKILFEKYEGYYFAELGGEPEAISEARAILEKCRSAQAR